MRETSRARSRAGHGGARLPFRPPRRPRRQGRRWKPAGARTSTQRVSNSPDDKTGALREDVPPPGWERRDPTTPGALREDGDPTRTRGRPRGAGKAGREGGWGRPQPSPRPAPPRQAPSPRPGRRRPARRLWGCAPGRARAATAPSPRDPTGPHGTPARTPRRAGLLHPAGRTEAAGFGAHLLPSLLLDRRPHSFEHRGWQRGLEGGPPPARGTGPRNLGIPADPRGNLGPLPSSRGRSPEGSRFRLPLPPSPRWGGGPRTSRAEQSASMPGPQGGTGAPTMSLGKLSPVGWVSSAQGKRRLTADMISPPLGDFRHTMHVGRGGDVFGDTSFLSNHGGGGGGGVTHRSPRSFLARKLQQVRRAGVPARRMASPPAPSPAPPAVSPIIKNAISLPQLNQAAYDSLVVGKLSFDGSPAGSTDGRSGYGLDSGFCTISRLPRLEKPSDRDRDGERAFPAEPELRRSDSLLSFRLDLDLGPSLLSELLGVMSLSEAPAAAAPDPATSPTGPAPAANLPALAPHPPPAPSANPSPRGHCPNGVAQGRARQAGGEGPRGAPGAALGGSGHRAAGWRAGPGGRHYTEMDARRELAGVLPQVRGSWESLDEEWRAPRADSSPPVPRTVQAGAFRFADEEEEDDEVKV